MRYTGEKRNILSENRDEHKRTQAQQFTQVQKRSVQQNSSTKNAMNMFYEFIKKWIKVGFNFWNPFKGEEILIYVLLITFFNL